MDKMEESDQAPEKRKGDRRTDRQAGDRRAQTDRRGGLERRRGPGRRRGEVRRAAEEGEISGELMEFVLAIDEYKRINERPFPTHSEIFEIVKYLGYRKVADVAEHINVVESEESG